MSVIPASLATGPAHHPGARSLSDVAPYLVGLLAETEPDSDADVDDLVVLLRRNDFSITQLHREIDALKRQLAADPGSPPAHVLGHWQRLDAVFHACLERTSMIYEAVLENSMRCYSEVDSEGRVVFANAAMRQLVPDCEGQILAELFGSRANKVRAALQGRGHRRLYRLPMRAERGEIVVSAEFGPVDADGQRLGGYAMLVDVQPYLDATRRAYEAATLGILQIALDHRILFANTAATAILEIQASRLIGTSALALFPEERNRQTIDLALDALRAMRGTRFELEYSPPDGGPSLPLEVGMTPEFDPSGEHIGALVSLRSVVAEKARQQIYAACNRFAAQPSQLIDNLLKIVIELVPCETVSLSVYTPDMRFVRTVGIKPAPGIPWTTQWFPVTSQQREWILNEPDPLIDDLAAFFRNDPEGIELLLDPIVKYYLAEGYRAVACLPVKEGGKAIGVLSVATKPEAFYRPMHLERLRNAQVEHGLRIALHALERDEQALLSRMRQELAETSSTATLARVLVSGLASFYGWQSVSIFKVNRISGRFELLAQEAGPRDGYLLPQTHSQALTDGLLGRTLEQNSPVRINDTTGNEPLAKQFVRACADQPTRSELCIPVRLNGRIVWIINLEDRRKNAFSDAEVATLGWIVGQLQHTLEQLFRGVIIKEVMAEATDGIVITDTEGRIQRCNPEARRLLELDDSAIAAGCRIESLGQNERDMIRLGSGRGLEQERIEIRAKNGQPKPLLVTSRGLAEEYDHRVLFLTDLARLQWQADIRAIKAAITELSAQTRARLSMVGSFIRRFSRTVGEGELRQRTKELVDRTLQQLSKIEISYDRVLLSAELDESRVCFVETVSLHQLISGALQELPDVEQQAVVVNEPEDDPVVAGNLFALRFVLRSVLAHLLDSLHSTGRIHITVSPQDNGASLRIVGPKALPERSPAADELERIYTSIRTEIVLGESVLRRVVETRHGGRLTIADAGEGLVAFDIWLPGKRFHGR